MDTESVAVTNLNIVGVVGTLNQRVHFSIAKECSGLVLRSTISYAIDHEVEVHIIVEGGIGNVDLIYIVTIGAGEQLSFDLVTLCINLYHPVTGLGLGFIEPCNLAGVLHTVNSVVNLDTDVLGEQGLEALGIGAIHVNIASVEVNSVAVEIVVNLGDVLIHGQIIGVSVTSEVEDLRTITVVNKDAVAQVAGIDHLAINIGLGQGEVEAAETTLVTTVIPLVSGGLSGNGGSEFEVYTEGHLVALSIEVAELKSGHAQVVVVVSHQTSSIVVEGELGVYIALGTQQVDVIAINHHLDLGGAIVDFVAHVGFALILINIGHTHAHLDAVAIAVIVVQELASGDDDHAGSCIIGTLYPGVVAIVPP